MVAGSIASIPLIGFSLLIPASQITSPFLASLFAFGTKLPTILACAALIGTTATITITDKFLDIERNATIKDMDKAQERREKKWKREDKNRLKSQEVSNMSEIEKQELDEKLYNNNNSATKEYVTKKNSSEDLKDSETEKTA